MFVIARSIATRQSILRWFRNILSWIAASASPPRNDGKAKTESGNAVIMILIAVALFGALSFTFMRGSKSGQSNLTGQQATIGAQEIINYAKTIERGVDKLRQHGCSESEISFANTVYTTNGGTPTQPDGHNSKAPVSGECDIFKASGANLTPQLISNAYTTYWPAIGPTNSARGILRLARIRVPGLGDETKEELAVFAPYVSIPVCNKINDLMGVANPSGIPPETTNTTASFTGTWPGSGIIADSNNIITGKTTFCVRHAGATDPWQQLFIQVLIVR